jgi:hypothetical protein
MPYVLPFSSGDKIRLNRIEKQFVYSAFTLPQTLVDNAQVQCIKKFNTLLCHSDITDGKYKHHDISYNIIWLDFPEECISNNIDFSIRDFSDYGIPPLILIRKHKPN